MPNHGLCGFDKRLLFVVQILHSAPWTQQPARDLVSILRDCRKNMRVIGWPRVVVVQCRSSEATCLLIWSIALERRLHYPSGTSVHDSRSSKLPCWSELSFDKYSMSENAGAMYSSYNTSNLNTKSSPEPHSNTVMIQYSSLAVFKAFLFTSSVLIYQLLLPISCRTNSPMIVQLGATPRLITTPKEVGQRAVPLRDPRP